MCTVRVLIEKDTAFFFYVVVLALLNAEWTTERRFPRCLQEVGGKGGPGREIPTSKLPPLEGLKLATTGVLHFNASLVKRRVKGKVAGPCS